MGSEDIDIFMEFALDIANRAKLANLLPAKGLCYTTLKVTLHIWELSLP